MLIRGALGMATALLVKGSKLAVTNHESLSQSGKGRRALLMGLCAAGTVAGCGGVAPLEVKLNAQETSLESSGGVSASFTELWNGQPALKMEFTEASPGSVILKRADGNPWKIDGQEYFAFDVEADSSTANRDLRMAVQMRVSDPDSEEGIYEVRTSELEGSLNRLYPDNLHIEGPFTGPDYKAPSSKAQILDIRFHFTNVKETDIGLAVTIRNPEFV